MPAHEQARDFIEAVTPAHRCVQRVILVLLGLLLVAAWAILWLVPASAANVEFWTSVARGETAAAGGLSGAFFATCFVLASAFANAKAPPLRRQATRRLAATAGWILAVGALFWLWSSLASGRCLRARLAQATPLIAAIERHIAETGKPPENLEALVPRYLAKAPPRRDRDLYQCRYMLAADGTWVFQFLVPHLGSAQIWDYDTGTPRWAGSDKHGWRRPVPVYGRWCLWP